MLRVVYRKTSFYLMSVLLAGLACFVPNPDNRAQAANVTFNEDFENGFAAWTADAGTPTTGLFNGNRSYAMDEDTDRIHHTMSSATNQVAIISFYDDATASAIRTTIAVDSGSTNVAMGVDTTKDATHYVYRIGSVYTPTAVTRTTGWHSFVFDYRSGTKAVLFIDGVKITETTAAVSFTKIAFGDSWSGGVSSDVYFDDVLVQDAMPPFPESFELDFANWEQVKGTPTASTAAAHGGSQSYMLNQDEDAIQYKMGGNTNKAVSLWFYDDSADTSLRTLALVHPNIEGTAIALGVDSITSTANYVYRVGTGYTATSVPRATGWHHFVFDYRSGTDVTLYIDGTQVLATSAQTSFSIITLGDLWADGRTAQVYFDDVQVIDCLPWETCAPLSPSMADAMGFETAGAWNSTAYFLEDNPGFQESDLLEAKTTSLATLNSGVSLSTSYVQEGGYSGKWANHPKYPTISTRTIPQDWSIYNTVSVSVYSAVYTNEAISMIAYSDNPATDWKEFYYYTFSVNWTGWKQLEVPLSAFQAYGETAGWNHVQHLSFSTKAFDAEPNPYTVLYLDALQLHQVSQNTLNQLLSGLPEPDNTVHYITKYPSGFTALTLDDYLQFVNNKLEYENASTARRAEIQSENDAILAKYGLGTDTYTLNQFVDTLPRIPGLHDMVPFDTNQMNNGFTEWRATPPDPIQYEVYWNNERALYGYYPHFNSAPVSLSPDGHPYLRYGDSIIETYNAAKDKWYSLDLEPLYQQYAQSLGWSQYRHKDDNDPEDVKIRFDNDGDAYMLSTVTKVEDGKDKIYRGIVLYSHDNMKTWQVYELPRTERNGKYIYHPFSKFEDIDTFNTEAMDRPPVITMHSDWLNQNNPDTYDPSGYLVLPEKLTDGTLHFPEPVKYCDYCLRTAAHHSGDANIALTAGGKVFLVYGVIDTAHNPDVPNIPSNAPAKSLTWTYNGTTYHSSSGTPAFIKSYDLQTGQLSDPVFLGYGGRALDNHNWPSLTIDSTGHLHAFINGHHDPTFYTSSVSPYDISSWNAPQLINNGNSYSGVVIDKDDTLYLITRNSEDHYKFNLAMTRKKVGQNWEPSRYLVERFKSYYENWQQKLTIDPDTGKLFLTYFGQSRQVHIYKDEYDALMYIWPDREKTANPDGTNTPVGTYKSTENPVQNILHPSEMATLVSTDGGDTWRLSQSSDYAP